MRRRRRRALEYAASGAARGHERAEPDELSPDEDEPPAGAEEPVDLSDMPFVIRNLDTGEATSIATDAASDWSKLSLGSLQPGTSAWESTKAECRGLLEKLARKSTFSFRSYQLCVWQERYVFAEDDALCYQQLSQDRVPSGPMKRIPYSSISFVGPIDDTQFVLRCTRRNYTFLCESLDARTRWIKSISMLAGCSGSTEVCKHTTSKRKSAKGAAAAAAAADTKEATKEKSKRSSKFDRSIKPGGGAAAPEAKPPKEKKEKPPKRRSRRKKSRRKGRVRRIRRRRQRRSMMMRWRSRRRWSLRSRW